MKDKPEAVIRMHTYEPVILTTDEYDALFREVVANMVTDIDVTSSPAQRILGKLLMEHHPRYVEAWEQNSGLDHPSRKRA